MDLIAAENMVRSMMNSHGLTDWRFDFDRAQRRLGACHHDKKTITMSRYFLNVATVEQVRQTALHEIAHALLPVRVGHSNAWKMKAASIGYTGERTASNPYVMPRNKRSVTHGGTKPLTAAQLRAKLAYEISAKSDVIVRIGDKLMVRDGTIVTITKRNPTRWKGVGNDGREWTIPHGMAPALKMQAEAFLAKAA